MISIYVYPDIFSTEDNGLLTGSSPVNEDLGSITLSADSRENSGSITVFTDIPDPYQLPEAYGSIADSVDLTDDYGLITESAFGNYFSYGELLENILRFDNLTSSVKRVTYSYNTSGTLSAFGGAAESRVYSYNDSTTQSDFYGSIIESVDYIIDYGLTSGSLNESSVTTDYGGILDPLTPYPNYPNTLEDISFFTISGDANTRYFNVYTGPASGTLSAFGGAAESRAYSYNDSAISQPADYGSVIESLDSIDDYGLISSSVDQIFDYAGLGDGFTPYGNLSINGQKVEKATYSYNESSIYTFGGYEDLGQLGDSVVYEDNGDLTYDYYRSFYDNYGYIVDGESSVSPFGTIRIAGDAITVKQGENIGVGDGTINVSGDATYKETNSEVGSGTLSAFGGSAESRVYSYNDSSISQPVDYESVIESLDSTEDYGFIINSVDQIFDYAGLGDGFTPYGTIVLSGDSTHKEIYNEVASGTIGALSGAAEVYGPNPPENTVLFTISGDATYSDINSEVASGTLSAFGGAAESRAYSYNDSVSGSESYEFIIDSIDSVEDYGLITSSVDQISDYGGLLDGVAPYGTLSINGQKIEKATYSYNESSIYTFGGYEDLGQLSDTVTYEDNGDLTYDYYRSFYDNYGYIVDGESSVSPFGTITVSGDAITARQGDNIGTGSGLVEIAGDATYKEINSEVGSGTLSAFGGAAESRVYSYNESSISESVSYGSIDDAVDYIDDHGFIAESVNPISDYGYILDDSVTPYGTIVLSGDSTHKEIYNEVASGTIGALSGAAEVYGPNPPENTVLFTFSGDATYSDINSEVASGTLSAFGGAAESRAYSYNDSSTGSESYGLVSEFIDSVDDYGLITASVDQIADYGGLLDGIAPYGTLNLSGQKIEKVTYSYNESSIYTFGGYEDLGQLGDSVVYEDYGNLEFTLFYDQYGYVADAETDVSPFGTITFSGEAVTVKQGENIDVGSGTIDISGNATYKEINSEVASGTLSAFGGAAESRAYSYNDSSISESVSYGSIDDAVVYIDDHGSITESVNPISDYGYILDDSVTPYGTVVLSGDSTYKEIYNEVASGTIGALSGAAEVYGPNPPEDTVLFTFSGDATYIDINSEVGTGSISAINGAAESRAYSYNDSSTGSESYGTVVETTDSFDDYGLIISSVDQIADYGGLLDGTTPYGTLQVSGQKVEKVTYSYNESSIYTFGGYEDLGQLSDSVVYEDYGNLEFTLFFDQYGYVVDAETTVNPFGTITFSGEAVTVKLGENIGTGTGTIEISGSLTESFTPATEIGSGTLSAFGGAAESRAYSYNDSSTGSESYGTILESIDSIDDYGLITSSVDQISDYGGLLDGVAPYGTLQISGQKVERATYSYNESSIYIFGGYEDLGQLSDTVTYEDNGDLTYDYNNSFYDNYGYIVDGESTVTPFGTITVSGDAKTIPVIPSATSGTIEISGSLTQSFTPATEIGSGTIGVLSGAAEAYGPNPPENTVLFTISGDATYKEIESWNASGTIDISGDAIYSDINSEVGSGTIEISGDATYKDVNSEVGSGTLSTLSGSAEVYGPNPPEDTVLFTFSGDAIYSDINSEVGSGTITVSGDAKTIPLIPYTTSGTIEISGSLTQSFTPATEVGSGILNTLSGSAEVYGPNPPEDTVLFTFSGDATYSDINSEVGSGTIEISGSAIGIYLPSVSASGTIEISGDATYSDVNSEVGSGTLSTLSGSAEVYGPNPPEDIVLFNISGDATYSDINSEVGSGTIDISGSLAQSFTPATEIGSGTLSTLSGSAEVYGPNPPEDIVLFTISGDATYSDINSEAGSGTIEISGTQKQDVQVYVPAITGNCEIEIASQAITQFQSNPIISGSGTIEVSGNGAWNFSPTVYQGSGSISTLSGSAEAFGVNPPEDTVLTTISGAANTRYFNVYTGPASGTIEVSGGITTDRQIYVPEFTGSGIIEVSGDAGAHRERPYISSGIISISGIGEESFGRGIYTGSGSFSIFGGHAEEFGANPPEDTVIGTISGSAVPKKVFSHTATGIATISGNGAWNFARSNYQGSGTLRTLSGSAEVYGPNPPENTVLFSITGDARQKVRFSESGIGTVSISGSSVEKYGTSNVGIGTLNVSGAATSIAKISRFIGSGLIEISGERGQKRTFTYNASGTLSAIRGSAEAFGANPPENIVILTIGGDANTRYFNVYTGPASGTIEISGGISTDRQIYVPNFVGSGTIEVSGDGGTPRTRPYDGSGTIRILGSANESYIRTTYNGSGEINVSGIGSYEYREYEPPFVYVTII